MNKLQEIESGGFTTNSSEVSELTPDNSIKVINLQNKKDLEGFSAIKEAKRISIEEYCID